MRYELIIKDRTIRKSFMGHTIYKNYISISINGNKNYYYYVKQDERNNVIDLIEKRFNIILETFY